MSSEELFRLARYMTDFRLLLFFLMLAMRKAIVESCELGYRGTVKVQYSLRILIPTLKSHHTVPKVILGS